MDKRTRDQDSNADIIDNLSQTVKDRRPLSNSFKNNPEKVLLDDCSSSSKEYGSIHEIRSMLFKELDTIEEKISSKFVISKNIFGVFRRLKYSLYDAFDEGVGLRKSPKNLKMFRKENAESYSKSIAEKFLLEQDFAAALSLAFNEAGFELVPKAAITSSSIPPLIDPIPLSPSLPLPKIAPRLWQDRPEGRNINPVQFIRTNYAPWLDAGVLTRNLILQIDKPLYLAYGQWIKPNRHPEDAIAFATGISSHFIADPEEAISRRRESGKEASARYRAKRSPKPSVS